MPSAQGLFLKVEKMGTGSFVSDDLSNEVENWSEKPVWDCYFFLENLELVD